MFGSVVFQWCLVLLLYVLHASVYKSLADSEYRNELLRGEMVNVASNMEVQTRETRKKKADVDISAVISPLNIDFQNGVIHFINNKAIQNVTRDNQLLTRRNLRIQIKEMLHGHDAIFSCYEENNGATKGHVQLMSSGCIVELDEGKGTKVPFG